MMQMKIQIYLDLSLEVWLCLLSNFQKQGGWLEEGSLQYFIPLGTTEAIFCNSTALWPLEKWQK